MGNESSEKPVTIGSYGYTAKTEAIIKILNENESRRNACTPDMIAKIIDEGLNEAGLESDLHSQYVKEMQISLSASLEKIMEKNAIEEPAIMATREYLEQYWKNLREILNITDQHPTSEPREVKAASISTKILNIASPVVNSVSIAGDYTEAMKKVKPYVDQKLMSAEAARDYAVAITEGKLEQNATLGLSNDLGNARIGKWVQDHPEIPNAVLQELGLGGVRELQKMFSGPQLES